MPSSVRVRTIRRVWAVLLPVAGSCAGTGIVVEVVEVVDVVEVVVVVGVVGGVLGGRVAMSTRFDTTGVIGGPSGGAPTTVAVLITRPAETSASVTV